MRLGLAALLLLALTGCGGSDTAARDEGSPGSTSTGLEGSKETDQATALYAAVNAYSTAYLTGDGAAAYALLSKDCKETISAADFSALVDQAGDLYGSALPLKSFEAKVTGDTARATYTFEVSALDQTLEPWVREDGKWLEDDC